MKRKWTKGIDISEYQGEANWKRISDYKFDFVYFRSNVGTKVDAQVERNCELAAKRGIAHGLYVFVKPEQDPVKQAQVLIDFYKKYDIPLVPQIDVESHGNLGPRKVRNSVKEILSLVKQEIGTPIVYTGAHFWNNHVKMKWMGDYPLWVARYVQSNTKQYEVSPVPVDPSSWRRYAMNYEKPNSVIGWDDWDIWQFSAVGNGLGKHYGMHSNDIDLNIAKPGVLSKLQVVKR